MKRIADRVFLDVPKEAVGLPCYEEYRLGVQRSTVGLAAILGGLAFNMLMAVAKASLWQLQAPWLLAGED